METLQDLIEEAKVRFVWWAICIFAICYFLSHTSKSMWMNIPISALIAFGLRVLLNEVEFRLKVPQLRKQTYLSYVEKKQLPLKDSRLVAAPPSQKWKKKIDSPIVQAAVEDFIDLILRDFVTDLWYSEITPDKEAPELMRMVVLDALGEVAGRVKEVNIVDLLTRDMIDLVGDHLELYRRKQAEIGVDVMGTLSSEERDERLKYYLMASKELHPALISPECEHKFLQQLMSGVLAVVLRQREAQCPLVRTIARELLTCIVIQPVLNLAAPAYINELIEFIVLNFNDVFTLQTTRTEACDCTSKSSKACTGGEASSGKNGSSDYLENNRTVDKFGHRMEKTAEASHASASQGENIHPKSTDWARVLDAATQRRSEVLAPENLENMWARGRHYKEKINKAAKNNQAKKVLAGADVVLTSDLDKTVSGNSPKVQILQGTNISSQAKGSTVDEFHLPLNLGEESATRGGLLEETEDVHNDVVNADGSEDRLQRSTSTLSSKSVPDEQRPNTSENRGIIISEFYSPDNAMHSTEQRSNASSNLVLHAEASHRPKLRCRVLGAYFERLGSKSFAVYSVAVTDSENNTWFVKRRYRNFERLHRHLKDIPNYTLHLPPKRIFSSSTEDTFVHQRCIQLDKYLQDLLSIANVAEQHEVWDFLSESSKNYSFGKSSSVMRTLAVNVDDAVDDIVRQFKGVSDGFMRKVVGCSSPSHLEVSQSVPQRLFSFNSDDSKGQGSLHSSIEQTHSSSDEEEVVKDQHLEDYSHAQAHDWHSDDEVNSKDLASRTDRKLKECKSLEPEKYNFESIIELKEAGRTTSLPTIYDHVEEPVAVPPEWTPPNVCVPALMLVDKVFQLNRRGWLRRQVFWISKQILQLVMEDAIDDFLLGQINWLRRDTVIAQGIRWLQNFLWPGGKFFMKLELSADKSDGVRHDRAPSRTSRSAGSKLSQSGSFEAQLQAARRANDVKKLLFNGAPTALVSFVGHNQYKRCARDIYYFSQSSICIKQLAYCGLELAIIAIFPELKDLVADINKKMRPQPV